MAIAVAISYCRNCAGLLGIGFFKGLTEKDDGVIIMGTLLLFPATVALYGVLQMWFAAKEAVEKRAMERGRRQERERIKRSLAERGITLPSEIASIIFDGPESDDKRRTR